jgi:hypothetical protein
LTLLTRKHSRSSERWGAPFELVETTSDWDLGFVGPSIDLEELEIVKLR